MIELTQYAIDHSTDIDIVVGYHGSDCGNVERYTGKRTLRAVKSRLSKERCDDIFWAHVALDGRRTYIIEGL